MLSDLGQQVAKLFGGRFSLTNLLPVTVLAALVWLLVIASAVVRCRVRVVCPA